MGSRPTPFVCEGRGAPEHRRIVRTHTDQPEEATMALIDRLRELVEPLCLDLGVELYDLDLNGGIFRVTIDKAGGVGIDDIAELTREVSRMLDAEDPISGRYTLEVSSPGLERLLRTPTHFARAVGGTVKCKLRAGAGTERRLEGELASADDTGIVLRTVTGERRVAYDDIDKARTVFVWGPTSKPGTAPKPSPGTAPKPSPGTASKQSKNARSPHSGAAATSAAGEPAANQPTGAPGASTESSATSDAVKVVKA